MGNLPETLLGFAQKTVLITGAASGIGRATAVLFSKLGAHTQLIDVNVPRLENTRGLCTPATEAFSCDLTVKENISRFWENLDQLPDVLVNNAGTYPFHNFLQVTEEQLKRVVDINLNSVFWMCQEFVKRKRTHGVIVNVSSVEAMLPFKKNMVHYTSAKAGVIALTRGLAHDYGRKGFRANVVLPGAIVTPSTQKLINTAITTMNFGLMKVGYDFGSRLPLGRWGKPEEVAKAIVFLASDMSSYVNGAVLPVDGGFLSS